MARQLGISANIQESKTPWIKTRQLLGDGMGGTGNDSAEPSGRKRSSCRLTHGTTLIQYFMSRPRSDSRRNALPAPVGCEFLERQSSWPHLLEVTRGHRREKTGSTLLSAAARGKEEKERVKGVKKKKKGAETMKRGNPKHFTWINSDSKSESGPSANQRQAWVMMSSLKPSSVTDCFWFCGGKGWSSVLILI